MQIDADGSPHAKALERDYGQLSTSLQYPGIEGQRRFVDAEAQRLFEALRTSDTGSP